MPNKAFDRVARYHEDMTNELAQLFIFSLQESARILGGTHVPFAFTRFTLNLEDKESSSDLETRLIDPNKPLTAQIANFAIEDAKQFDPSGRTPQVLVATSGCGMSHDTDEHGFLSAFMSLNPYSKPFIYRGNEVADAKREDEVVSEHNLLNLYYRYYRAELRKLRSDPKVEEKLKQAAKRFDVPLPPM